MASTNLHSTDRRLAREVAQDTLLEVAERLAGVDGAASLSLKRLADEAGVSTMVIYSRFGDRFGLEEALTRRAVDSIIEAIEAAPPTIVGVGNVIREWTTIHRSRFSLLFLTGHLLDATLRPEIDQSIRRIGRVIDQRLGWTKGRAGGPGITALAAMVGYLTFELREQVTRTGADAGYHSLLASLEALQP